MEESGSTEVCVIPENPHCVRVSELRRADLAPGGSLLLGCLRDRGLLEVLDPADREAPPAEACGKYTEPLMQVDQDSLWSSSCSLSSLGSTFSTDRSWEARLSSMYSRAQPPPSSSSSSSSSPSPWSSSLPHLYSQSSSSHSRVPLGGATVSFSVPESSAPSLLTVTEFSAQLTFVSPGNTETTVALWEMESGNVTQHRAEGEAAPEDLLSRLMLFGSAATVDAVCHLNSWGRCSIPIHSLQAGLKNRQLDTELCSALDLLCSAVRESNSEAQSRQFSEQLLNITLSFINRQIRSVLTNTQHEDLSVQVEVLDRYVTELRSYMKRFPWPVGGDTCSTNSAEAAPLQEEEEEREEEEDEWEKLQTEEVVRRSILTNQIPRAQAVLRGRGLKEQRLSALRRRGLQEVFTCLQHRDLHTANTLLTNMQLRSICLFTDDYDLRDFVVEELSGRRFLPEEEVQSVEFMKQMERLGSLPAARSAETPSHRGVQMVLREGGVGEEVLQELLLQRREEEEGGGLWKTLRLDWVRNWDQSCRTAVLLSRLPHTEVTSCDAALLWRYLTSLHDQRRIIDWIQNEEVNPELDELCDLQLLLWRLSQGGGVMSVRSPLGLDLHSLFISFCVKHSLHFLLYSYLQHHRLTPRNCPLLTNQSLSESEPWFEMMVKIQEISTDLSGTSTCSITRIHLSGHSLLALASLMFSPGGIDQRTVDAQLLKMALTPHPKLRSALFPRAPRRRSHLRRLRLHLLQALHPLDPCRLFGWHGKHPELQRSVGAAHFSSSHLVSSFALMENLDFLYFLRHGRPSSAFATFLKQQLSGSCDVPLLLQQALQQVSRLAMQCVRLAEAEPGAAEQLIGCLEAAVTDSLEQRGVARSSYEAAQDWSLPVQFCQLHSLPLSSVYASHCAQDAHFINFLLFVQLHNFPPQQGAELVPCLCVWVLTSVDDVTFGEATSHLADVPPTTSGLCTTCQSSGRRFWGGATSDLCCEDSMFELCCDYRNFSEAKAKLLDFQRTLISRCSSQYDLHRLLLLLRDVHKLLKSNGPDFRKLSELSELLQGSEVSLPPRLLQCTSPSVQQEELQAVVDALQEAGRFREARQGAMLGGLPTHTLLLTQDVNSQKSKRQWSRLETRVSLWRKCHEQLQADGIDPEPASLFFLSQAKKDSGGAELLEVQERCLLLLLSSHWLSRLHPAPRGRLESLEKQLWAERETTSSYELMVKEFCFSNIPCMKEEEEGLRTEEGLKAEEGLSTEEGLRAEEGLSTEAGLSKVEGLSVKEGLSKVEGLSTEEGLSMKEGLSAEEGLSMEEGLSVEEGLRKVEGLSAEESLSTEELREEDTLSPEERCILGTLVDQLLDEGSIHEASRELQLSFRQIHSQDPGSVLQNLLQSEQPERFRKARAFIKAQSLSAESVSGLLASSLMRALLDSSTELQPSVRCSGRQRGGTPCCHSSNSVTIQTWWEKTAAEPELCSSERAELHRGASDRGSRLLQPHLQHGGNRASPHRIGRYNEMTYVFDLLHQNHRFEMLLRKKMDTDRGQHEEGDRENHEMAARTQLKIIESQAWAEEFLVKVLGLLKDAAESFSKATRCVRTAKLVALQLHFLKQDSDLQLVNLQPPELLSAVTALPSCYQKVILSGDFVYLEDFKRLRPLTSALFEDIFKKLDGAPAVSLMLAACSLTVNTCSAATDWPTNRTFWTSARLCCRTHTPPDT
ncbi:hypothetical protein F7725_023458 [Dissostichus mawsoni]|uniref:Spatacsin C-terminal domain-containing protein n=1 Tax=Dissostichus mawsoni TaxID=36200 RepID=A0A7J5Z1S6_DISMA|nr:hypothetical protein F7725_023458 [Dissostichus mawsoni]